LDGIKHSTSLLIFEGIHMNTDMNNSPSRLVRIKTVVELTGLSKSYIYDLSNKGIFPKSIQLVPGGSSVAWIESEIQNWIDSRIQSRDSENLAQIDQ
jgi:prophage regulatory protein